MSNKGAGGEKLTDEYQIDAELSAIVEQNILPPRIAEKIGEKLKGSNIEITRDQLYKLVEKIQSALRNFGVGKTAPIVESADMKTLVEAIEKLEERIKYIEENRIRGTKGVTGKLVRTKDIKTVDFQEEDLQPLYEVPNDPESVVVIMKWLQYLVDKTGKNNLPDILSYYVDIDWISDDVRLDLIKYSKGITDEKHATETEKGPINLTSKDHIQSLLFIQKLKGNKVDERIMWRIDREMEKMAKSIEDHQFK